MSLKKNLKKEAGENNFFMRKNEKKIF